MTRAKTVFRIKKQTQKKKLNDNLDDMVVECFDEEEKQSRLRRPKMQAGSQNCLSKLKELQKIQGWRTAVDKIYKRRIDRKIKEEVIDCYLDSRMHSSKKEEDFRFSKESLELVKSMDEGKRLADSIEFKFAINFGDLKDMSTMIALTAGASAVDIGINKYNCAEDIARSISQEQKLKQP